MRGMSRALFERIAKEKGLLKGNLPPDPRVPRVPRTGKKKGLHAKIEELLAVAVSRKWISHHLKCPQQTVDRVTVKWKQEKLPAILAKRA